MKDIEKYTEYLKKSQETRKALQEAFEEQSEILNEAPLEENRLLKAIKRWGEKNQEGHAANAIAKAKAKYGNLPFGVRRDLATDNKGNYEVGNLGKITHAYRIGKRTGRTLPPKLKTYKEGVEEHETLKNHETNPFHKILDSFGFKHISTEHKKNRFAASDPTQDYTQHTYERASHDSNKPHRVRVDVHHSATPKSSYLKNPKATWFHYHVQSNGIVAPSYAETKPSLKKTLERNYGALKEDQDIQELSSKTLDSYASKAIFDKFHTEVKRRQGKISDAQAFVRSKKRSIGMGRAWRQLDVKGWPKKDAEDDDNMKKYLASRLQKEEKLEEGKISKWLFAKSRKEALLNKLDKRVDSLDKSYDLMNPISKQEYIQHDKNVEAWRNDTKAPWVKQMDRGHALFKKGDVVAGRKAYKRADDFLKKKNLKQVFDNYPVPPARNPDSATSRLNRNLKQRSSTRNRQELIKKGAIKYLGNKPK